jgi:hypothetical protein
MHSAHALPASGLAEIRIIAATPEAARRVTLAIRQCFEGHEQRSYPAGADNSGTRLHLTIDTNRLPSGPSDGAGLLPAPADLRRMAAPHSDEIRIAGGFRAAPAAALTERPSP